MEKFRLLSGPKNHLPSKVRRFGFDCDGTLTDADSERVEYVAKFRQNLAQLLRNKSLIDQFDDIASDVSKNLSKVGWIIDGKLVCPAHTDGIIFCQAIGRKLLIQDGFNESDVDSKMLGKLYKDTYTQTIQDSVFRKGTAQFLSYARSLSDDELFVLTNSGTDAVEQKLSLLRSSLPRGQPMPKLPVSGSAMKFALDDSLTSVPEFIDIPNGARIYCRRKIFMEKLDSLFGDVPRVETVFVGDSLSLDGVIPLHTGRIFFFLPNSKTPDEEIHYVLNHPNGYVIESLELR